MSGPIKAADLARKHQGAETNAGWLFRCPCPGHGKGRGDKSPSLLAWDADDGLALECKSGCSRADVLTAFKITEQDVRVPKKDDGSKKPKERKPFGDGWLTRRGYERAATYPYTTLDGTLLYQVLRYEHPTEDKEFLQRSPNGAGGWYGDARGADAGDRKVPYRWPELAQAIHTTIWVTEGEKDTDRLIALGFSATTVASGSWSKESIEALKGLDVFILEDNDAPGRIKAKKAAAHLYGVAATVRIVRLPGLAEGKDVSNWLDAGNDHGTLIDIAKGFPLYEQADAKADAPSDASPEEPVPDIPLSAADWLARDLPEPDFIMGEWFSTTSRVLLVAPTGLGKTNFAMALGAHAAASRDFLHWRAKRKVRVLYIDGEMSRRLMKRRLMDATRRLGHVPDTLFILSHEDIPDFSPLNTPKGQAQVEAFIRKIGGVDVIVFDNIMSLISGCMKDEESWQQTLPWIRSLTARDVGQIWVHHTGHDETRSYGTKTREWQLDTVIHLETVKRPDTDVSFDLTFKKARERTPDNRDDFETLTVALLNNTWEFTSATKGTEKRTRKLTDRQELGMRVLFEVLAESGCAPPPSYQLPKSIQTVVGLDQWQAGLLGRNVIDRSGANVRARLHELQNQLVTRGLIAVKDAWVWSMKDLPMGHTKSSPDDS